VFGSESLRYHRNRLVLVLGCNQACVLSVHGHLSLTSRRRHLGLRAQRLTLAGHHSVAVFLTMSREALARVKAALRHRRHVSATVEVQASPVSTGAAAAATVTAYTATIKLRS
jgi:hypothetical protein